MSWPVLKLFRLSFKPWLDYLTGALADVGHEVPTAPFASLVTIMLGAPAAALGLIEGLAEGLAGLVRFAGGVLADNGFRGRNNALGGYSLTALLPALIGVARAVWQVALLRMVAHGPMACVPTRGRGARYIRLRVHRSQR
jgi:hypothetical protein